MKPYLRILLFFVFLGLLYVEVSGQAKPARTTKKEKAKEEIEPPPQVEELKEVRIDTSSGQGERRIVRDSPVEMPMPEVNFDTTTVPDDAFTRDILKLLEVTNGINIGTQLATAMTDEKDASMKEFYTRFMKDMKEGTTRRWMERIYVRAYRKRFTHEEIKELIGFYEGPLGKKLISQTAEMLPGIMEEGKRMGAYQGMKIYMEMMKEKMND